MSKKELCLKYLRHYAKKELTDVSAMFADDIVLRDWKIAVHGKAAATDETAKNFASADTIEIEPISVCENNDTVAAELRIVVDGAIELHVVDVLTFSQTGKIQSIRAYLGKGAQTDASKAFPAPIEKQ